MPKSTDLLRDLADHEAEETDLLADLNDDNDAEAWVPEQEGDGIQGTVIGLDEMPDQFKDDATVPVVIIETTEGECYRILAFASVLRKEITKAAPRVGDTLAVKYFGEKILKTGRYAGKPFHHYRVAVRRNTRVADEAPF